MVRVSLEEPHVVPLRARRMLLRCCILSAILMACCLNVNIVSKVTPRIFGLGSNGNKLLLMKISGWMWVLCEFGVK